MTSLSNISWSVPSLFISRARFAVAVVIAGIVPAACATTPTRSLATESRPPESACFPVEQAPPGVRALADSLLLEFGDREGLYTLAGGLKPLSSDVRDMTVRVGPTLDSASLQRLDTLRQAAALLTCGDIGAFVQVFTATQRLRDSTEVRATSTVIYHRRAVQQTVSRHAQFFATLGITPAADPREVLLAVENAPRASRWRGYGYLFGYPDEAVDFFVQAGEDGDRTGALVPRDFVRIETHYKFTAGDGTRLSTFVYAVPKGATRTASERQLIAAADSIFARYAQVRTRITDPGAGQAVALWRQWVSTFPSTR